MLKMKGTLSDIIGVLLVVLLIVTIYNTIQIQNLGSLEIEVPITGEAIQGRIPSEINQIAEEVLVKEGEVTEYGLTFSTNGLNTLVDYANSISLTGDDQQRYISIGTQPNTACEYCCGIGNRGALRNDGRIACGCAHNIAFAGLIKYLIQEGYTDEQILDEILRWKSYFFPRDYLAEVLKERGISPEASGLPAQRGGC